MQFNFKIHILVFSEKFRRRGQLQQELWEAYISMGSAQTGSFRMYHNLYFSIYSCLVQMKGNLSSAITARKADMFWHLHLRWCMLCSTGFFYARFVNVS